MAAQGKQLLQQLDTTEQAFQTAVQAAYESGNRFWLWQRLTRASNINGGILTIEQGEDVPLHDHPGATGMVRVLTGEVEVWQFDRPAAMKQARKRCSSASHIESCTPVTLRSCHPSAAISMRYARAARHAACSTILSRRINAANAPGTSL